MFMEDLLYKIALTRIPLVGPITARLLVSYCGSAAEVFSASKKSLLKISGIGEGVVQAVQSAAPLQEAEKELEYLDRQGIEPFFYLDAGYPSRLKSLPDAPIMLYFRGSADLNHRRVVAVVGTRQPSAYGQAMVEELILGLAPYNPLIISGLAYGIDAAAHRFSLDHQLDTIGVLGHGLSLVYPAAHRSMAERMLRHGGLLSEFTYQTEPEREHFPMRNRIVAGLCDALVVVETGRRGGSVITAQFAAEYGKPVFAVPGRVREKTAEGCNLLIKTNKALLIESAEDIAHTLQWQGQAKPKAQQISLFNELTADEEIVVNLLRQHEQLGVDRLSYETNFSSSTLATALLELECKGMIKTLPGKRYTLK